MIQVIFGEKGAGKTKKILDMANESAQTAKGSIVFVADDGQYMFGLKRDIRFVDASSFHIDGPKMFYGFLCGLSPKWTISPSATASISSSASTANPAVYRISSRNISNSLHQYPQMQADGRCKRPLYYG